MFLLALAFFSYFLIIIPPYNQSLLIIHSFVSSYQLPYHLSSSFISPHHLAYLSITNFNYQSLHAFLSPCYQVLTNINLLLPCIPSFLHIIYPCCLFIPIFLLSIPILAFLSDLSNPDHESLLAVHLFLSSCHPSQVLLPCHCHSILYPHI